MSIDLILENASKNDIQMLKYHASKIFEALELASLGQFSDDIDLLDLPDSIPIEIESELDSYLFNFSKKIHKNKELGENHVNAFLATVAPQNQINRQKYLIIQARLLLAVFVLSQQKGYEGFIQRALREYRLLIEREKWAWLDELPDFTLPIYELIIALEIERETLPYEARGRILAFVSLFRQYQKNRLEYVARKFNKGKKLQTSSNHTFESVDSRILFDEDETSYSEYLPEIPEVEKAGVEYNEHASDQVATKRFFKFDLVAPEEVKKSLSLQATAAKSAANHIQRREKMLITDFTYLTQYEISILIKHCFKNLDQNAYYACLLIMLFTGKSMEETLSSLKDVHLFNKPPFNEYMIFLFKPELPDHVVDSGLDKLLDRSAASVIQALPSEIRDSIILYKNQLSKSEILTEQIKNTIKELNKSHSTNLTLGRITNYMAFYLNNKGIDSTEIALILGRGLKQESGSYYYQANIGDLLTIHQDYIKELMEQSGLNKKMISERTKKTVGSQLIVKEEKIQMLFLLMAKELEKLRVGGWKHIEKFHNLYVVYCIELLNLSTGHRPVRNPYEDINKFDLVAGTLFISDKEERSELAARVLALPNIAVLQTKMYLEHLKNLESEISNFSDESGKAIQNAISGKGPLFFFLSSFDVVPVIPSNLSANIKDIWSFPLNWHRHFMRTWLRQRGFSGQWVNAWMGHLSYGSDGFSRYSGLTMADLNKMAERICEFLEEELKIITIKPWDNNDKKE